MKLAMAQMQMDTSIDCNLAKTIRCMERAAEAGADLIFFPEVQLTPFSPSTKSGTPSPGPWTRMAGRSPPSGMPAEG